MLERNLPRVSAIIVNYNSEDVIGDCLTALLNNSTANELQVYVIDNGSTDGSALQVSENFPPVKVIRVGENIGFARGNNLVLNQLNTEFTVLVNPDVVLSYETLLDLVTFMDTHPEAAIVGPKQLDSKGNFNPASKMGRATITNTLCRNLGLHRLFPKHRSFSGYYLSHLDENQTAKVDAVSGACMLLRTKILQQLGGFDESFPLGCEDLDLCYRAGEISNIYYYPLAIVTHRGRHSRKKNWEESIKRFTIGAKLLYTKYEASQHSEIFNTLVIKGLELSAVARIGLTRLLSRLGKKE